jgi:restriction system protein
LALKKNTVANRDVTSKTNASNSAHDSVTNQENLLPLCPSCGSSMVSRIARKGKLRGNKFYGCSQYPRCKGLINV